ncbi:MAG: hypothetical protein LBP22_00470 [Deltaproteobacteria bacterium]|jgi:hypothetical protein|nr:hypothetical protein [Deltaproteobacteria bacterium]
MADELKTGDASESQESRVKAYDYGLGEWENRATAYNKPLEPAENYSLVHGSYSPRELAEADEFIRSSSADSNKLTPLPANSRQIFEQILIDTAIERAKPEYRNDDQELGPTGPAYSADSFFHDKMTVTEHAISNKNPEDLKWLDKRIALRSSAGSALFDVAKNGQIFINKVTLNDNFKINDGTYSFSKEELSRPVEFMLAEVQQNYLRHNGIDPIEYLKNGEKYRNQNETNQLPEFNSGVSGFITAIRDKTSDLAEGDSNLFTDRATGAIGVKLPHEFGQRTSYVPLCPECVAINYGFSDKNIVEFGKISFQNLSSVNSGRNGGKFSMLVGLDKEGHYRSIPLRSFHSPDAAYRTSSVLLENLSSDYRKITGNEFGQRRISREKVQSSQPETRYNKPLSPPENYHLVSGFYSASLLTETKEQISSFLKNGQNAGYFPLDEKSRQIFEQMMTDTAVGRAESAEIADRNPINSFSPESFSSGQISISELSSLNSKKLTGVPFIDKCVNIASKIGHVFVDVAKTGDVFFRGAKLNEEGLAKYDMTESVQNRPPVKDAVKRIFADFRRNYLEYNHIDPAAYDRLLEKNKALSPAEEVKIKMKDMGFVFEGEPVMDGTVQKVKVQGDKFPNQKSGSYRISADGQAEGWIRNFKTGEKFDWAYVGQIANKPDSHCKHELNLAGQQLTAGIEAESMAADNVSAAKQPETARKDLPEFGLSR